VQRDFTGGFCSLFDMQLVVRMFATCFKKREHHRRAIVFLVIITLSTCIITLEGKDVVLVHGSKLHIVVSTLALESCFGVLQCLLENSRITP
jgi:hypothetical protein